MSLLRQNFTKILASVFSSFLILSLALREDYCHTMKCSIEKEIRKNQWTWKTGSSPSRALRWLQPLPTPWLQSYEELWARKPNQVIPGFLTHRNCDIINTVLRDQFLEWFVMKQNITNIQGFSNFVSV